MQQYTQVTAFRASDGKLFESEQDAKDYEFTLTWQGRIVEFIESGLCPYTANTQLGMVNRIVTCWELFKQQGQAYLSTESLRIKGVI